MNLFKKRCMYCREKIEKGQEKFTEVKVPGYVGTFDKPFCSDEHANSYKKEINEQLKNSKSSCCG